MVVVENIHAVVMRIDRAADARVARTEIAVFNVSRREFLCALHNLADPRTILPVSGDDHPLFAQWMPPLLPHAMVEDSIIQLRQISPPVARRMTASSLN